MKSFCTWAGIFLFAIVAVLAATPDSVQAIEFTQFIPTDAPLLMGVTIGGGVVTLSDWAKRRDPDGRTAKIVEMLSQTNGILDDAHWEEGNLPTGHRTTVRTGLPVVTWRMYNRGVPTGKSTTAQVDVQAGMLEARGQVDVDLAGLNADVAAFRLSEAQPFVEAMSQEFASTMIYGTAASPEEFVGLAASYSSLSAPSAKNIIDGGGNGSDNCSIYLVVWGPNTVHCHFPKGSKVGLVHEDLGIGDAFDDDGNRFRAYLDRWQWKGGVVVRDWRYAVRIPNIDVSALVAESSNADLTKLMTKAWHRIPSFGMGRAAWYMNRTCAQYLDIQRQAAVKAGGGVTWEVVDGKNVMMFRGIPIRITDALLETEEAVS